MLSAFFDIKMVATFQHGKNAIKGLSEFFPAHVITLQGIIQTQQPVVHISIKSG